MCTCGESLRSAWISRRLFTWSRLSKWFCGPAVVAVVVVVVMVIGLSHIKKLRVVPTLEVVPGCSGPTFMHLIATYFPFLMHCAFSTSEKVPYVRGHKVVPQSHGGCLSLGLTFAGAARP
jgi:hypothetical protein